MTNDPCSVLLRRRSWFSQSLLRVPDESLREWAKKEEPRDHQDDEEEEEQAAGWIRNPDRQCGMEDDGSNATPGLPENMGLDLKMLG